MFTRFVRYGVGVAVSAVAIVITLQRVNVGEVASAMASANPGPILLAIGIVVAEVAVRAARWQRLLRPIRRPPYLTTLAYLCIGFFANTILPARLGDVTRAYLAGTAFGVRRTTTLGTILVERMGDGLLMLATVIVLGSIVPVAGDLVVAAITLAAVGVGAVVLALLSLYGLRRSRFAGTRAWGVVDRALARLWAGTVALRRPLGFVAFVVLTLVGFAMAVTVLLSVAQAVGVTLTVPEAALATAGLALSLAIPAAPGSVGTYELVGLTVLSALGVPPDRALAAVVLQHAVIAIPPALAGMVAMWVLHVRVGRVPSESGDVPAAIDPRATPPILEEGRRR